VPAIGPGVIVVEHGKKEIADIFPPALPHLANRHEKAAAIGIEKEHRPGGLHRRVAQKCVGCRRGLQRHALSGHKVPREKMERELWILAVGKIACEQAGTISIAISPVFLVRKATDCIPEGRAPLQAA